MILLNKFLMRNTHDACLFGVSRDGMFDSATLTVGPTKLNWAPNTGLLTFISDRYPYAINKIGRLVSLIYDKGNNVLVAANFNAENDINNTIIFVNMDYIEPDNVLKKYYYTDEDIKTVVSKWGKN